MSRRSQDPCAGAEWPVTKSLSFRLLPNQRRTVPSSGAWLAKGRRSHQTVPSCRQSDVSPSHHGERRRGRDDGGSRAPSSPPQIASEGRETRTHADTPHVSRLRTWTGRADTCGDRETCPETGRRRWPRKPAVCAARGWRDVNRPSVADWATM